MCDSNKKHGRIIERQKTICLGNKYEILQKFIKVGMTHCNELTIAEIGLFLIYWYMYFRSTKYIQNWSTEFIHI